MAFSRKIAALASASVLGLIAGVSTASAGGFINQSQSTVFNGSAYAGYAAGGSSSPSSMFLNPATMTQFNVFTSENNFFGVFPYSNITGAGGVQPGGAFIPAFGNGSSGDIGQDAFTSASYFVYPVTPDWRIGLAINSPFGFTTKPNYPWVGQLNSASTKARTFAFTPSVAYKISETFSVGFGVQIQHFSARLASSAVPFPANPVLVGLDGDGWGYGITAGLAWNPMPGTHIGVGYRSQIDQEIEGDFFGFPLPAGFTSARGTLKLPDRVNVSLRQTVRPDLDILASIEWQNWSRIGTAAITGPALANPAFPLRALPFEYDDGWYFALGAEYRYSPALTLRAGLAYEISPVSDQVRSTRLTDNDRLWLSGGLSYQISNRLTINASYSHVFVKDAPIRIVPGNPNFNPLAGNAAFIGEAKSHVDIISLGLTSRWGDERGAGVLPVVRKY